MKRIALYIGLLLATSLHAFGDEAPPLIRSAGSGRWSAAATWEGGRVPGAGARVQVRSGHVVTYDLDSDAVIRSIHVAGTLRFDPDRETRLDVGLIKIQVGDDAGESGFDCEAHVRPSKPGDIRPALEVGMPGRPIPAGRHALIRLTTVTGLDPEECPAIVCCGGRMDIHGAELEKTWVKLGVGAKKGQSAVSLAQAVPGWRPGDRVIVTATQYDPWRDESSVPSVREKPRTEERTIRSVTGTRLELDTPLAFNHSSVGAYFAEVALLSRNVVIESADPGAVRGHTMYHRYSAGSISYAEFRHLGKAGKLGKYSLHFHRAGDTMRGSSVIGASIWDSGNRWITIHGTNALVVRDCVGYRSIGHGFFLEDGTEVDNILDGNLAVEAFGGTPLPEQALPFDRNEGAGFWWANCRNAFMRNVAVECDTYGFRYEAPADARFNPVLNVRRPDGSTSPVDIRTQPFLRFDDNEAHTQRRYGVDLGGGPGSGETGGVGGVGPDARHPFVIRRLKVWNANWAVTLDAPSVLLDGIDVAHCGYGFWRPRYDRHAYRNVKFYHSGWTFYAERGKRPARSGFPAPLAPVDDSPPFTVITRLDRLGDGRLVVRGTSVDNVAVQGVRVNGRPARPLADDFSRWEAELDSGATALEYIVAEAVDAKGNVEPVPHRMEVSLIGTSLVAGTR